MRRRVALTGIVAIAGLMGLIAAERLTPSSPIIGRIDVGTYPFPVAIDGSAHTLLVGGSTTTQIQVIDTQSGHLLHTARLDALPQLIYPANSLPGIIDHHAYVLTRWPNGRIYNILDLLDTRSGRVLRSAVIGSSAPDPLLAVDARTQRVFLMSISSFMVTIDVYNAQNLRPLTSVVSHVFAGNTGWSMAGSPLAIDSRTGRVFVSDVERNSLSMLDARNGRLLKTINLRPLYSPMGGTPQAPMPVVSEALGRVYVVDSINGVVHTIDAATGRVLASIPIGQYIGEPIVDAAARRLLVVHRDGRLSLFDARSGRLISANAVGPITHTGLGLWALSRSGDSLYTSDFTNGTVRIYDGMSGHLRHQVDLGGHPYGIAVDDRDRRVFVVSLGTIDTKHQPFGDGNLAVLDWRTGTVLRRLALGIAAMQVFVDAAQHRAFVVGIGGQTVKVADPWGWIPSWLRPRLPFVPHSSQRTHIAPSNVVVLDLMRL